MKKKILALIGVAVLSLGTVACTQNTDTNDIVIGADEVKPDEDTNTGDAGNTGSDNAGTEDGDSSSDNTNAGDVTEVTDVTSTLDAFNVFWNNYPEAEKFAVAGGDYNNFVDGAPGTCNVSDTDTIINQFYIPEAVAGSVDDMASLVHMMNANTFTGVIVHTGAPEGFADALKENISNVNWVCGFPDRLIVADLSNGYFAYAFGEASIMSTYEASLKATFPSAQIVHDVNLAQ